MSNAKLGHNKIKVNIHHLHGDEIPLVTTANPNARQIRTLQLDAHLLLKVLLDRHHLAVAVKFLLVGGSFDPVASNSGRVRTSVVRHLEKLIIK